MSEARAFAAEVVKDYPEDTNTYGKRKLALIQQLQEKKMKGGLQHVQHRRTDGLTPSLPVDVRGFDFGQVEEEPEPEEEKIIERPKVGYTPARGPGSVVGSTRLGRQF